ncbi:MAG: DNA N-6-adenine-methyltransferase [Akkermansiaceae bacterium]
MSAGRKINTLSQEWGTPEKYVSAVKNFFGGSISLDPCSNQFSIVGAGTEYKLPKHDGLKESWDYKTIYVNPPYGIDKSRGTRIAHWLYRCAAAHKNHNSEILALIPVASNTGHWKNYVWTRATAICFLYDTRLKFLVDGKDEGKGAPMSCAMVYWGKDYNKFEDQFLRYGAVTDLRPIRGKRIGDYDIIPEPILLDEY